MKSPGATLLTRSLIESARLDRPSDASKSRIWDQVALAPQLSLVAQSATHSVPPPALTGASTSGGGGAGGSAVSLLGSAGAVVGGGFSAGKLLVAGALVGSVMTVGLGLFLLRGASQGGLTRESTIQQSRGPREPGREHVPVEPRMEKTSTGPMPVDETRDHLGQPAGLAEVTPTRTASTPATHVDSPTVRLPSKLARPKSVIAGADIDGQDALTREVALVSEARTELLKGRASAAIELLDASGRNGSHSLEPEALSLRARALRSLGREEEAVRVEESLKARFPEHFLAR